MARGKGQSRKARKNAKPRARRRARRPNPYKNPLSDFDSFKSGLEVLAFGALGSIALRALGINPFEALARLSHDPAKDSGERAEIAELERMASLEPESD